MLAHPVVAAVSDRRRRSSIDATIYVPPYSFAKYIMGHLFHLHYHPTETNSWKISLETR
jgi:hypothetical protein